MMVCRKTHERIWYQHSCFWQNMTPYTMGLNVKCLDKGLVFVRISIWGRWCDVRGNFAFTSCVETEEKGPELLFLSSIQVTGFKWWETLTGRPPGYRSCPPCGLCRGSNTVWPVFSQTRTELRGGGGERPNHRRRWAVIVRKTQHLWGVNLFAECPRRRRELQNWNKNSIVHASRCRVIYASEIVLVISSLVPWDQASYWSQLNWSKYLKTKKTVPVKVASANVRHAGPLPKPLF